MRQLSTIALAAALATGNALAIDVAQQTAPADGFGAGTIGGSAATPERIYTVHNRAELLNALANAGNLPKIIKVAGTIDMTEGLPYANTADQKVRSRIRLTSNTTLIGEGPGAGFINAWIDITSISQVIVRNLHIVAPCDVGPVWDPTDGATGNWNSAYDAIGIVTATQVWIDRNTITDDPVSDDTLPIENGKTKQCHDGAIDITKGADLITVSYNVVTRHDKSMLIGGSDSLTSDAGKLRTTIANNVFDGVTQRVPRVRFGQVHVFNNYFTGSKSAVVYPHLYSIGVGKDANIISNANVFAVDGAVGCDSVISYPTLTPTGGIFQDSGSLLNGAAISGCTVASGAGFVPPYAYKPRPAALVKANNLAQAGAGKITTQIAGNGNVYDVAGTKLPAAKETAVPSDTRIALSFDAPPTIGTTGKISIYRVSDDALVDSIDLSNAPSSTDTQAVLARTNLEIDAIGLGAMPENAQLARYVWYRPVSVKGSTATIRPHSGKLDFGTAYYVTIDAAALAGTIKGGAFAGISKADGWTFTTRAAPASFTQVSVDDTGTAADFRTLQGALNWVMKYCSTTSAASYGCNTVATPKTITVANGTYTEMNQLRRVSNLSVIGESRDGVVIGDDNFESLNSGSGASSTTPGTALSTSGKTVGHRVLGGGRASWLIESCDLLTLQNFTLQNPHDRTTSWDNQAETLYFNTGTTAAAGRLVAKQMNFLSQQDTLQLKGYNWFYQSLIAGNVDYIWGSVMATLFEESEIRSVADAASNSPGYIVQSRATAGDKGFVFLNSRLTAGPGVGAAYLARSGGTTSTTYVDDVAFVNTKMGAHILPVGWCVGTGVSKTGTGTGSCSSNPPSWSGTADGGTTDAAGWREFNSMDANGAPLDLSGRLGATTVKVNNVSTANQQAKVISDPTGLATRAEVFYNSTIATGAAGGWAPVP
ncbi:Ig-like domain-containing protein [Pelomonas sp. KK5]|uniref:pectate lyase family protein n=1 Tax=Pelomonas sp. KK5 TaxID=1855730 RepID=UPI00097BF3A1|nr:Ig-like domain-containing protein [Pelomonas sp. KK5]